MTISLLTSALVIAAMAAGEPPLDLDWQAPATCPDRAWALARLASDGRLGKVEHDTRVLVRISEQEGGFVADLETSQGAVEGTRSLEAATCGELAEAVVVVLTMALMPRPNEPEATQSPPATPPQKTPEKRAQPAAPEPPSTEVEPALPSSSDGSESSGVLRVGIGIDWGSLPSTTFGFSLAGGVTFGDARVELRGAYWLPRSAPAQDPQGVANGADVGGDFSRLDGLLFGCWGTSQARRLSAEGCLGLGMAALRAEGYGLPDPTSETRLFGVAGAELAGRLALSKRAALRLGAGALVPWARETYAIEALGAVFTPDPLEIRAEIASEMRF